MWRIPSALLAVLFVALVGIAPVSGAPPCGKDHAPACSPPPTAEPIMGRTNFFGFETKSILEGSYAAQDLTGVTEFQGTGGSYETTIVRTGAASLKIAAGSGVAGNRLFNAGANSYFGRVYVRVTSLPASTRTLIAPGSNINTSMGVNLTSTGALDYTVSGVIAGTSTTTLTDTTKWYRVEWRVATAGVTGVLLRIDGVDEVTATVGATTTFTAFGAVDTIAASYTAYFDDASFDNAAFPGDGKVVLLVPVSDNADGSWTKPGGGTTVNATSVDNLPPIGIADTTNGANAENQIRNPTANDSYVANMTTYTNAGIGAADTINAVLTLAAVGAPTTTGAKTGSMQLTANPAEGAATAFGTTSNRYHSGNNAGTFKSGWARVITGITSSPSVTLGNNPTLSMNITGGTTSRIAMICFMGVYVDYTPAVSALAPPFRSKSIHNALVR